MLRRSFLKSLAPIPPLALCAGAALAHMKIKSIRYYHVGGDGGRPAFNQSSHVVTVETDQGITGLGGDTHKGSIE